MSTTPEASVREYFAVLREALTLLKPEEQVEVLFAFASRSELIAGKLNAQHKSKWAGVSNDYELAHRLLKIAREAMGDSRD